MRATPVLLAAAVIAGVLIGATAERFHRRSVEAEMENLLRQRLRQLRDPAPAGPHQYDPPVRVDPLPERALQAPLSNST